MNDPLPAIPQRDPLGHKGTFGTVAVFGGACHDGRIMIGAPVLAARAALRAGTGLVKLTCPAPILSTAIALVPSVTGLAIPTQSDGAYEGHEAAAAVDRAVSACDVLVIGPGMGEGPGPAAAALRAVQQHDVHVVVDADALNALSQTPYFTEDFVAPAIITPHPGEFARLAKSIDLHGDPANNADRPRLASELAQRLGCIVVLKGASTVVSDGLRTWANSTGNSALATAGSGDVLAGLIGSLVAQFVAPPQEPRPHPMPPRPKPAGRPFDLFDAARLAVFIHGRAAELWCSDRQASAGMLAEELADLLPRAIEACRAGV